MLALVPLLCATLALQRCQFAQIHAVCREGWEKQQKTCTAALERSLRQVLTDFDTNTVHY